ncbi:hypothetical protein OESDEN_07662 [Oesophagostomum dentatum]|uniref:Uncharacterized protein n=1 Tax=Oesophagostomum dentatum TaxID=61180 RepID=A0A0B1T5D0_OESDE|nr:hypothetical protein OESDEN_07662 [Oesophagostomum dentatum]
MNYNRVSEKFNRKRFEQQADWMSGKRKISNILLEDIQRPDMKEILQDVDTTMVLSWSDLLVCHPSFRFWMKSSYTDIKFALRNNSNQFIIILVDGNSIILRDPFHLDSLLY